MIRALLFIILLAAWPGVYAQESTTVSVYPEENKSSERSQYIRSYPDNFFIWPVLKQRRLDFDLRSTENRKNTLAYKSNRPYSLGIGMYLFELGVEIAFAIPLDEKSKRIYGDSDSRDIQMNILGKKWGADLFIQSYDGFYIDDPDSKPPSNTPYPQRSDISTRNFGASVNYIFNHNRFSFRSAYNFAERQLQSAGSVIAFGSLADFQLTADSALAGDVYRDRFGESSRVKDVKSTVFGAAPGYTYSLIYRGFFLNGAVAIGPAYNWSIYNLESGGSVKDSRFTLYTAARISIGYNGDRIFGGFSFINQEHGARFEKVELSSSNSTFKILVGYRFNETGFLKKRIWDLPKTFLN